jgi:hypothetical protein
VIDGSGDAGTGGLPTAWRVAAGGLQWLVVAAALLYAGSTLVRTGPSVLLDGWVVPLIGAGAGLLCLARVGGDEFAVLLADTDPANATSIAQRLLGALTEPFDLDGDQNWVGVAGLEPAASSL